VTDECENSIKVDAETIVLWPTVITPNPKDGFNDDFIVDLDEHLAIIVFDRYGNKVYEGDNGWPNNAASIKMPGVYYYKVTLPDGTIKKGPIEIFKTKN
jgi:gliding motility-associated-like protein